MAAKPRKTTAIAKRTKVARKKKRTIKRKRRPTTTPGCCGALGTPLHGTANLSFGGIPLTVTFNLDQIPGTQQWKAAIDLSNYLPTCLVTMFVDFACDGGSTCGCYYLNAVYINWCGDGGKTGIRPDAGYCQCPPTLSVRFSVSGFDPCCIGIPGSGTVTITS